MKMKSNDILRDELINRFGDSHDGLRVLGFAFEDNGDTDPRSHDWNIKNQHFHLWVDPWCHVFMRRLNPDTDSIQLDIDGVSKLQTAIAFIQP